MRIHELENIVTTRRGEIRADSLRNCGLINKYIFQTLEENEIWAKYCTGNITDPDTGRGTEHVWLEIGQKQIRNSEKTVVVDGALDQFCISNYELGECPITLGPKEDLPQVAVFRRGGSSEYEKWYNFKCANRGTTPIV